MPWPTYLAVYAFPAVAAIALLRGGVWSWAVPLLAFGLVPLLELALAPRTSNVEAERRDPRRRLGLNLLVYAAVPVQVGLVLGLMARVQAGGLQTWELLGLVGSVGINCGALGINLGHELGHRGRTFEQRMAKVLLGTSLYGHFFIEHNRGHHSRVATDEDPATSRRGENLYAFWVRSVLGGWRSAWSLEALRLSRETGLRRWWKDEMLRLQLLQVAALGLALAVFGPAATLAWVGAAVCGFLLLETVNYIEHYGLQRGRRANGRFEAVRPHHSWNSDHPLGRALLFELTRHSDHHAHPKREFTELRHFADAPQLPTGYPGMVLLATLPPAFFAVMDRRLEAETGRLAAAA